MTYPPEALSPQEFEALLEANNRRHVKLPKVRDRALMVFLVRTGVRISEALALRVKDVDFENGSANVLRGKGGKRRTIGVDAVALAELQKWLDVRVAPMGAAIFCNRNGRQLAASTFRDTLHALGEEARIDKRIHPHMFRHTFTVEATREGAPAAYIQRQLGHSSLATTTRYQSTLAPQEVIDWIRGRKAPTWAHATQPGDDGEELSDL